MEHQLHHGDNPGCSIGKRRYVTCRRPRAKHRPFKGKGELRKRIDGILSTVYSLSGAMLHKHGPTKPMEAYMIKGLLHCEMCNDCKTTNP